MDLFDLDSYNSPPPSPDYLGEPAEGQICNYFYLKHFLRKIFVNQLRTSANSTRPTQKGEKETGAVFNQLHGRSGPGYVTK